MSQAGSGACCTPINKAGPETLILQEGSLERSCSTQGLSKNPGEAAAEGRNLLTQTLTTDRTQQHSANPDTKPGVAWLDTDTVPEKAQGVWFCVTKMHRKQNRTQFCYKARVHAEISFTAKKGLGGFLSFQDGRKFFSGFKMTLDHH